jgi:hypothetical protein
MIRGPPCEARWARERCVCVVISSRKASKGHERRQLWLGYRRREREVGHGARGERWGAASINPADYRVFSVCSKCHELPMKDSKQSGRVVILYMLCLFVSFCSIGD